MSPLVTKNYSEAHLFLFLEQANGTIQSHNTGESSSLAPENSPAPRLHIHHTMTTPSKPAFLMFLTGAVCLMFCKKSSASQRIKSVRHSPFTIMWSGTTPIGGAWCT